MSPSDERFVEMLLATPRATLKPLVLGGRKAAAWRRERELLGNSVRARREARKTLCRVWARHGRPQDGQELIPALLTAGLRRVAQNLLSPRWTALDRVEHATERVPGGLDYRILYADLLHYAPETTQKRWRAQLGEA